MEHASAVHGLEEALGEGLVLRDDGLRVAGAVPLNVLHGVIRAVHDLERDRQVAYESKKRRFQGGRRWGGRGVTICHNFLRTSRKTVTTVANIGIGSIGISSSYSSHGRTSGNRSSSYSDNSNSNAAMALAAAAMATAAATAIATAATATRKIHE